MTTSYKSGEKSLTPKQQEKLLEAVDSYRDEILIRLTLSLGCRRADIVRIEWRNINWQDGLITYLEKKKKNNPHSAYVSNDILLALKRWRKLSKSDYIFPGKRGATHMADKTAYNIFNRALHVAGITDKPHPFHALRATCIKNCQAKKWTIMETAKHVNDEEKTISKYYLVPSMAERQEAARDKAII